MIWHVLMCLEPIERVCWLKMTFPLLRQLTALPQIPQLDLRGQFEAGEKRGKEKGKSGEVKGWEEILPNEFLVTVLPTIWITYNTGLISGRYVRWYWCGGIELLQLLPPTRKTMSVDYQRLISITEPRHRRSSSTTLRASRQYWEREQQINNMSDGVAMEPFLHRHSTVQSRS